MTQDDVLFGYRLQLFALAAERGVSRRAGLMGVHRSTYYRWKARVDRTGLELLKAAREAASADSRPALGARRAADCRVRAGASRARPEADRRSAGAPGMGRTRGRPERGLPDAGPARAEHARPSLALVAGYRAPFCAAAPRAAGAAHRQRPAGPSSSASTASRRPPPWRRGPVWQVTAIDTRGSFTWADLVVTPAAGPTVGQTCTLARRVAAELQATGSRLERVLTDNGGEFSRQAFASRLSDGVGHVDRGARKSSRMSLKAQESGLTGTPGRRHAFGSPAAGARR